MKAEQVVDIIVPNAGESVSEATVLEWLVEVGQTVGQGETVVEISTDKVDIEIEAPADGKISEIVAKEGETVAVGQLLGRLEPLGSDTVEQPPIQKPSEPSQNVVTETDIVTEPPAEIPVTASAENSLAAEQQVSLNYGDLTDIDASALPLDEIAIERVRPAKRASDRPASEARQSQELSGASRQIADAMTASLGVPTATSVRTIVAEELITRRDQLKEQGIKLSFTQIIALAITKALAEMPQLYRYWQSEGINNLVIDDGQINLGIAVDVERRDGSHNLLVPVIKNAGQLPVDQFTAEYSRLIEAATSGNINVDDLRGANVTLTNPGSIGTEMSVPRLLPGQGAIIASGKIDYPAGMDAVGGAERVLTLTSTYDHRIIQGAESGQLLALIDQLLNGQHHFYYDLFGAYQLELPQLTERPKPDQPSSPATDHELLRAIYAATNLIRSYRTHGHLAARLDPLGSEPKGDPSLDPDNLDLSPRLMSQIDANLLDLNLPGKTLAEALPYLRETYCGHIAYEIEHITSHEQRNWFINQIEQGEHLNRRNKEDKIELLRSLIAVSALERFLHKAYLGQKQFSIEGLDATVPMINKAIELAAEGGADEVIIGMAHRGRLNVLAHNLDRNYQDIFAEFEGGSTVEVIKEVADLPRRGTGDVKYHHGEVGQANLSDGRQVTVRLQPNPSHLEFVNPVVLGATRAAQTKTDQPTPERNRHRAAAIVLHGDAAFPGQGVVAETLNLQALPGYQAGGTLHIVQNNQVGFTTTFEQSRSTYRASDLAKGFDMPIIHVNADDVEATISAVNLAMDFRNQFGHDIIIDLIGYRRWGHNEADEPSYTQPEMYQKIKDHPPVAVRYADQLIKEGVVTPSEVDQWNEKIWMRLKKEHNRLQERVEEADSGDGNQPIEVFEQDYPEPDAITTIVSRDRLRDLAQQLIDLPDTFTAHPKLDKQIEKRFAAEIDWAGAEALAFASLVEDGVPIRLSGQDSERGTFSQRHLVLHDNKTGVSYLPLQNLTGAKASIEVYNSPLSESACLGFEYGYAMEKPEALVLWEAQFGDFVNGAQVIIDQFISSGLSKWGDSSRLTLLLPHGYEGAGPEHSSARLERFLQLAAEGNLRIANPSTPAQYFHLLRRQSLDREERPLIIMTPKSLLRNRQTFSDIEELASGYFNPVIDDPINDHNQAKRLLLCSGKIYYDLQASEYNDEEVAVVRIEELYPFPEEEIKELLSLYPNLEEIAWVQEEPRNMGAREYMVPRLVEIIPPGFELGYIGRPDRAATGEGYPAAHRAEQERIIRTALNIDTDLSLFPRLNPGER